MPLNQHSRTVSVVAGPNGAGKSTLVENYLNRYAAFQTVFSNGVGWGIAILCLLGSVVGGIAQALVMRFGLPGTNLRFRLRGTNQIFLVTPLVGVASGVAIMVGTGVATGVYRSVGESTGWSVDAIATFAIGTCLMCLVGGLAGSFASMFFKLVLVHRQVDSTAS